MFTNLISGANWLLVPALVLGLVACGAEDSQDDPQDIDRLEATLGPGGGKVEGPQGTLFEGLVLVVPPGALAQETELVIREAFDEPPLPEGAHSVGAVFRLESSAALTREATLQLPFSRTQVTEAGADLQGVKVWLRDPDAGWTLIEPSSRGEDTVTLPIDRFTAAGAGIQL
jgi:hypothetical protein